MGETFRVAEFATWTDFGTPGDRIPRGVGPFNMRAVRHLEILQSAIFVEDVFHNMVPRLIGGCEKQIINRGSLIVQERERLRHKLEPRDFL